MGGQPRTRLVTLVMLAPMVAACARGDRPAGSHPPLRGQESGTSPCTRRHERSKVRRAGDHEPDAARHCGKSDCHPCSHQSP